MASLLLRGVLMALLFASYSAHASLREGPACELSKMLPGEDKRGDPWRRNPPHCERLRFVEITRIVPQAPGIVTVPDPTCGKKLSTGSDAAKVAGAFVSYYSGNPALGVLVADLADQFAVGKQLVDRAKEKGILLPKQATNLFYQKTENGSCTSLIAVLPSKAKYQGYRLVADNDRSGPRECNASEECSSGFAKFLRAPVEARSKGLHYVHTDFMNWSHDSTQAGRMIIFYEMPKGSKQPRVVPAM